MEELLLLNLPIAHLLLSIIKYQWKMKKCFYQAVTEIANLKFYHKNTDRISTMQKSCFVATLYYSVDHQ